MDAPTRNGIDVPKWKRYFNHLTERSVHHEDCDRWHRLGKERISSSRYRRARQGCFEETVQAGPVATFFVNLRSCLIGMEACGSAHHWARKLQELGHTVRLMAPQFVKPYVQTNKNDAADAEAISEAVGRPNMRFVPVKNVEQQAVLALHRVRQGFVKARTAQANQIRGVLGELSLILPGVNYFERRGRACSLRRTGELLVGEN